MTRTLLTPEEIEALADTLPLWTAAGGRLTRSATASTFVDAIGWVDAIAVAAEELDHHPDIDIRWRTLNLAVTTHSAGGLTELDVALARRVDEIVQPR